MKIVPIICCVLSFFLAASSFAAPSKPKEPKKDPAVEAYNAGTEHLFDLEFPEAEEDLRKAVGKDPEMAAAHNNLAFALRKQGEDHFKEALSHYNRAIELDPQLAEAYMYQGVLYVQMGKKSEALKNHEILVELSPGLANELEFVISNGSEKEPEQFFGVTGAR